MIISNRHHLLLRVSTIVAVIVSMKLLVHFLGWEVLSINPLFSGIVAANVFLMGFLLSGVLSDFKESERLPGELSVSLENLAQEVRAISMVKLKRMWLHACLLFLNSARTFCAGFSKNTVHRHYWNS